jgi:hypothetical protein
MAAYKMKKKILLFFWMFAPPDEPCQTSTN